ncbi:MAG: hypothetical protein M3512_01500 [Bacteroidota bacterium]|nr:hypothetical protein [Bacteroidota bacterium]
MRIERIIWNDPAVNWADYEIAILKSPWDYHEKLTDFYTWLDMLESSQVSVLNSDKLVRWNSDKHYLKEIADAGLNVISTLFLEKGTRPDITNLFDQLGTDKIIIKPCVSAGAKSTAILRRSDVHLKQNSIYQSLRIESYMAQPFFDEIYLGEWSYLFFNGIYSHSVLKVPKNGDFRVQHYLGGSIIPAEPKSEEILQAAAYIEQFASDTLYARVDGLIRNGRLYLMELELIEPYLFLNAHTDALENYYHALAYQLHKIK